MGRRVPRPGPLSEPERLELLAVDGADPLQPGVTFTACMRCPKHPIGCCGDHHPVFTLWDLVLLWSEDVDFVHTLIMRWRPGLFDGAPALLVHAPEPACPYADPLSGCTLSRSQRPVHCNLFICSGPSLPRPLEAMVGLAGAWRAWVRAFGLTMAARWALTGASVAPGTRLSAERLLELVPWAATQTAVYVQSHPRPVLPELDRAQTTRAEWFRENLRL